MNIFDKARKDHGPVSQQSPADEFSHIETVRPPKHQRDDNPEVQARLAAMDAEKKLSRRKLVAGLIGGAVIAGSATLGIREATKREATPAPQPTSSTTENPTASTEPTTDPTASETQPSASETQLSREEKINSKEIKAGLEDKEYADAFLKRLSEWAADGTSPELYDKWLVAGEGSDPLLREIAAETADIFPNALLKAGWESEPSLYEFAKFEEEQHYISLYQYVQTSGEGSVDDIEPLRTWFTADGVRKSKVLNPPTDGGRVIEVIVVEHNNNEDNRYKDVPETVALDGDKTLFVLTTTIEDDVEKVSSMIRQDIPQDYSF